MPTGYLVNGSQNLLSFEIRDMIASAGRCGDLVDPEVFRELTELVLSDARHGLGMDPEDDSEPVGASRSTVASRAAGLSGLGMASGVAVPGPFGALAQRVLSN
jgi:hypothetical protein